MHSDTIYIVLAKGLKDYKKGVIPELNRFQLAKIKKVIDLFNSLSYEKDVTIDDCEHEIKEISNEIGLNTDVARSAIARLWLSCYEGYSSNTLCHLQKRDWESFLRENGALCPKLPKSDICNELIRKPVLKCVINPHIPFNKWISFQIENEFLEN